MIYAQREEWVLCDYSVRGSKIKEGLHVAVKNGQNFVCFPPQNYEMAFVDSRETTKTIS